MKTDNEERWIVEDRKAIRNPKKLKDYIRLTDEQLADLMEIRKVFRMKITPYYLNLINKEDPDDPLLKMCLPDKNEMIVRKGELDDPIGDINQELDNHPTPLITHRYPDRVLLFPTPFCGGYCRYCFRRRLAGNPDYKYKKSLLEDAFSYLEKTSTIREVILSGGDPLMLYDDELFSLLGRLKAIPHIRTIRIHTRMPVWNPYRITDDLAEGLTRFQPIWIVTHFNHPNELSDTAIEHISKLIDRGIMVLNQGVLLKGVNDTLEVQRELLLTLIENRIKPYYLHYLDKAEGISHFRTDIKTGIDILKELRGTVPGYAIPHYILDIPRGYGKVPFQYHYINEDEKGNIIVETPEGDYVPYSEYCDEKSMGMKEDADVKPIMLFSEEDKEHLKEVLKNGNGK
ncbi:MAG: KamA family radical SAM protein [Bacteroidales bacterium]|jgi:lysine 2,3-aminomutase